MNERIWKPVPIKEVYLGFYDGVHGTPKPSKSGPVFLGIKNLTDDGHLDFSEIRHIAEDDYPKWVRRVEPRAGDIVFTYEATLNRYAIIPEGFRGCLGRRLALIRPNPERVNTKFLFYYFFGEEWRQTIATRTIHGATVDRVPIIDFPNFEISLPPLDVQRRIASILSCYDDLIENNTRRIQILEEMARGIYREWFVEKRFPKHAQYANGELPEGWQEKKLGEVAREVRRTVQPNQVETNTPYIGLEHMPRRSIALAEWGDAEQVTSTKMQFQRGEILFGKIRPYFHKVGVALIDGICSSDIIVIAPNAPEYFALTLMCVSSDEFVQHATQTSQGTKMPRANWGLLTKYPILIPASPLFEQFNQTINDIVNQIQNLVMRNRNLRRTRDLLLPKLVSGEIDVSKMYVGVE